LYGVQWVFDASHHTWYFRIERISKRGKRIYFQKRELCHSDS
jgi:hypothetical protein